MTALDANTALRPYREARYDLKEILSGLSVLTGDDPAVHVFRYADGSTAPMAPAALIHSLVTSLPQLVSLAGDGLHVTGDGIALDASLGIAAAVDGDLLEHAGEGPVPVRNSSIGHLTVGTLTADDASKALAKGDVPSLASSTVTVSRSARAGAVRTVRYSPSAMGTQYIGGLSVQSAYSPSAGQGAYQTLYVSQPNVIGAAAGGPASAPAMFGKLGLAMRPAEGIVLEGKEIRISVPALGARTSGHVTFTHYIPYMGDGTLQYLPVASVGAAMEGEQQVLRAPDGMWAMLLWPMWSLTTGTSRDGNAVSYNTAYRALAGTFDGYPIVHVVNRTGTDLTRVPNAWQFGKRLDGTGSFTVLSTVTIPKFSSVEFLFAYDGGKDTAYMYPTRALPNG